MPRSGLLIGASSEESDWLLADSWSRFELPKFLFKPLEDFEPPPRTGKSLGFKLADFPFIPFAIDPVDCTMGFNLGAGNMGSWVGCLFETWGRAGNADVSFAIGLEEFAIGLDVFAIGTEVSRLADCCQLGLGETPLELDVDGPPRAGNASAKKLVFGLYCCLLLIQIQTTDLLIGPHKYLASQTCQSTWHSEENWDLRVLTHASLGMWALQISVSS